MSAKYYSMTTVGTLKEDVNVTSPLSYVRRCNHMIFYRFGGHYSGRKEAAWADLCERHNHQAVWRRPSLENEPVAGAVRGKVDAGAAAIADHLRVHKVGGGEVGRLTEPVRRLLQGTGSQSRILWIEFHERRRQTVHCRLHWMSLNELNNFMVSNNKKKTGSVPLNWFICVRKRPEFWELMKEFHSFDNILWRWQFAFSPFFLTILENWKWSEICMQTRIMATL